nr:MAG TPA: hypothetical protein [Caudoviricetes sp.]
MKRLFITLLVVVIGSLTMLGQTLSIMKIGEEILNKNNFLSAKQIVKQCGMKISEINQTSFLAYSDLENGSFLNSICCCSVNAVSKTNKHIKMVRFYFDYGSDFHYRLKKDSKNMGYTQIGRAKEVMIIETGVLAIQTEHSNGKYLFLFTQAVGEDIIEVRFKRK